MIARFETCPGRQSSSACRSGINDLTTLQAVPIASDPGKTGTGQRACCTASRRQSSCHISTMNRTSRARSVPGGVSGRCGLALRAHRSQHQGSDRPATRSLRCRAQAPAARAGIERRSAASPCPCNGSNAPAADSRLDQNQRACLAARAAVVRRNDLGSSSSPPSRLPRVAAAGADGQV